MIDVARLNARLTVIETLMIRLATPDSAYKSLQRLRTRWEKMLLDADDPDDVSEYHLLIDECQRRLNDIDNFPLGKHST